MLLLILLNVSSVALFFTTNSSRFKSGIFYGLSEKLWLMISDRVV